MRPPAPGVAHDATDDLAPLLKEALLPGERAVVLLGSQKSGARVGSALLGMGVSRRVALITAGWQERERDDAALVHDLATLGIRAVNLLLHARSEEVFSLDKELAAATSARQERLKQIQEFYRIRLDYTGSSARAISVRHVDADILEQESRVSVEQFRQLDRDHVERCRAIDAAFTERWRVHERPMVARNIRVLRGLLDDAEAVVIAGGHVASLLNRLKLFDIAGLAAGKHLVACSAGAMALTERIVLFHDHPPYGTGIAQVLAEGLALAPGLVILPEPRRRIDGSDRGGIARFARRMAPSTCVALDESGHVALQSQRIVSAAGERLGFTGDIESAWRAKAPPDARGRVTP